jgi:type IV pilus assembly protein PilW
MKRQHGFTLVELMVATGLGLLLSLAATQLFVANQVSFNFQRSTGDVQANGRYAIDKIASDLRMAGLPNPNDLSLSGMVMTMADAPVPSLNYVSRDSFQQSGISTDKSDQLVLQYAAPTDMVDCEGNTVLAGSYIIERYYVTDDADTGFKGLACDSATYASGAGAWTNTNTTGVILAPGVDSFKVLYGLDDGGVPNDVAQISRWVTSDTYRALPTPIPIVAVRVGLYVHSLESTGSHVAAPGDVWVLNTKIPQASVPNDNYLRRLFVTSVALRNVVGI